MSVAIIAEGVPEGFSRFSRDAGGARVAYSAAVCEDRSVRRIWLRYREQLHIPPSSKKISMLEGRAWVTMEGLDYVLAAGDCLSVCGKKGDAVISALGEDSIVIELS